MEKQSRFTLSLKEVTALVELFSKAYGDMKYAVLPQLPLELAVIEWSLVLQSRTSQPASAAAQNDTKQGMGGPHDNGDQGVSMSSLRKQVGNMAKIKTLYGEPAKQTPVSDNVKREAESDVDLLHSSPNDEITQEWLNAFWKNIILEMKQFNHTIAGVLRGCAIGKYDKKELVIVTAFKFHKEKLDEIKTQQTLLAVCKQLTGNDVQVRVELKK